MNSTHIQAASLTLTLLTMTTLAQAQTNTTPSHVDIRIGGDNLDVMWSNVTLRHTNKTSGHQLGASIQGGLIRERFVGGFAVDEGASLMFDVHRRWLLKENTAARFHLKTGIGAHTVLASEATSAGKTMVAMTTQLVPSVTVDVSQKVSLTATVPLQIALAMSPAVELDLLETPMSLGLTFWLSDTLALTPTIFAGGAFGYGGDGAKHRVGASIGLLYAFDARASNAPLKRPDTSSTGAFVSMDWRGMNLANHLSHGPGFAAGVAFWGGRLKLGIAGINRPGPINPKQFNVIAADGQTYKGDRELNLKSDGSIVGVMIGTHVPLTEQLALDIPVTIGQGGFGFYLAGDDRETPDGRRVSEWENELQDGRDASFGLGIDAGLRLMWTPTQQPWLRPFVGAHYSTVLGYEAFAKDNYGGASVSFGAEFLVF